MENKHINVYYVARRHFNAANPQGFLINAVVIDDEVYTVPTNDFKEGRVRVNALPLSELIDLKRTSGIYDPDFEERIAGILYQEEILERRRFDLFRLEQESKPTNSANEEIPNPAVSPSYYEFIGAKKPDGEEELLHSFIRMVDKICEEKNRLILLRRSKNVISPRLYDDTILELRNGMRSKFNFLQCMGVDFDNDYVKQRIINVKKRQLEELHGRPITETGDFISTRIIDGNYRFFETATGETKFEDFIGILDFALRMKKSRQLREIPIRMETDEASPDPQANQSGNESMDMLVNALSPLALQEANDAPAEMSGNLGAVPKRRHN